jgi:hypothetical protein
MNEEELLTDETLAGAEQNELAASDGGAADSDTGTVTIREVLAQTLGKDFTDDETALKAVKDTFSYVGEYGKLKPLIEKHGGVEAVIKKMEEPTIVENPVETPAAAPAPATNQPQLDEVMKTVKDLSFYTEHPELKPYKDVISAMGSDPEKVVESEVFKKVIEPLKSRDEADASKSVLHSTSRVADVSPDYQEDMDKAIKSGNWVDFLAKHKGVELG